MSNLIFIVIVFCLILGNGLDCAVSIFSWRQKVRFCIHHHVDRLVIGGGETSGAVLQV
ncbi:hypothetical protein PND93_05865 [Faecalicoccus pleomorphus]|uniref:hypothetical protein n=1 Tax=Faecalicoccus pleomorphus TaxID=1323 RepID=UPI00232F2902|nr:hypothetical protein [Faecalicoccus pleomorphus]MDB7987252.1 hypothetical protein [Faecalicoccus pleomorphus]MDB7991108.1 hypothetical protein [Faecalicoccus pleomorphus]